MMLANYPRITIFAVDKTVGGDERQTENRKQS